MTEWGMGRYKSWRLWIPFHPTPSRQNRPFYYHSKVLGELANRRGYSDVGIFRLRVFRQDSWARIKKVKGQKNARTNPPPLLKNYLQSLIRANSFPGVDLNQMRNFKLGFKSHSNFWQGIRKSNIIFGFSSFIGDTCFIFPNFLSFVFYFPGKNFVTCWKMSQQCAMRCCWY